ncbi:MAG: CHRD domain-containing protein [Planctomycetaceae bacterium]
MFRTWLTHLSHRIQHSDNRRVESRRRLLRTRQLRSGATEMLEDRCLLTLIDLSPLSGALNVSANPYTADHAAGLSGLNEGTPNASVASGNETGGGITYDEATNVLSFEFAYGADFGFNDLESAFGAAHIHGPGLVLAPDAANMNAGILFNLVDAGTHTAGSTSLTGSFSGMWTLSDAQEEMLFDNALYINIHSATIGSGEIRAQLIPVQSTSNAHVALSDGNLTITDLSGTTDDSLNLAVSGTDLVITNGATFTATGTGVAGSGTGTITIPLANITGPITINGRDGDDSVTVDFSGGNPVPGGLTFDGGTQNGASGGDSLTVLGTFTTQTISYTTTSADGNNGSIDVDGAMITFTGLEPVTAGDSADTILNLPADAANNAVLQDSTNAGEIELIDNGTTIEDTIIPNPTNSLTINLGNQGDALAVNALDAAWVASLIINGGTAATDDVQLTGVALVSTPGRGLWVTEVETLGITGGTISGNSASIGGGILIDNSTSGTSTTATIDSVAISGNTATGTSATEGGGGLFNNGASVTIQNGTVISGNVASGTSGSGGGIFNAAGGILTISGSSITGNTANRAGGGIEDASGAGLGVTLTGATLAGNSAGIDIGDGAAANPGNGGGLHVTGAGDILIDGGTINGNVAALEGGGLWNGTGTMTIQNGTVISGNTASGDAADDGGGGIFNNGGTLTIDGTASAVTISGNLADGTAGSGGGIFSTDGMVSITGASILSNSANRAGGGIEVVEGTLLLTDTSLTGNDVDGTAAGTPNPGNGGGIHITGAANTTVSGGMISNNHAANEGGGLWNNTGTMTIQDAAEIDANTASGNAATNGGGGIFNNGGTLIVDGSNGAVVISNNAADGTAGSGGGIFNDDAGTLTISFTVIQSNGASRAGGGIEDNSSGSTSVTSSTLTGNSAGPGPGNGGALHITANSGVTISNSTISGNSAANEGGGLWNSSQGTLTILNSTITGNHADSGGNGGGLFTDSGGATGLTNTIVAGNDSGAGNTPDDIAGDSVAGVSFNNLIGDAASSGGLTDGTDGNLVGDSGAGTIDIALVLNPVLADNGGLTPTHALIVGSPAINAGMDLSGSGITLDQRGVARPQGTAYDIGAAEIEIFTVTGRKFLDLNGDGARLPQSVVDLNLFAQNGNFFPNTYGGQEKWVRSSGLDWHFILPDGTFTRWDRTPGMLSGTVVANLNVRYYIDPFLLTESDSEPYLNGWTIELLDSMGMVIDTAVTADIDLDNSGTIDPETERGVYRFQVVMQPSVSIREVQQTGYRQSSGPGPDADTALMLDDTLNLRYTGNYFTNFGGLFENWLRTDTGWVYILPDGKVFEWDRTSGGNRGPLMGTEIAQLDPIYHASPQLLWDAVDPVINTAGSGQAAGPTFGNYQPVVISGRVFEDLDRSGSRQAGEPYTNNQIVQLLDRANHVVAEVSTADVDLDNSNSIDPETERGIYEFANLVPGTYTVRHELQDGTFETTPFASPFAPVAYRIDQQLDLVFTGDFFENFGTEKERWLFSRRLREWVYIKADGSLFQWDRASGPAPGALSGTFIARLDNSYYVNPETLYDAQPLSLRVISGDSVAGYDFGFYDIDRAFEDFDNFGNG